MNDGANDVQDGFPVPDPADTGPYVLLVTLRAKPEMADELERRLLAQVPVTRAEPGNLFYTLNRDRLDASRLYFYEAYTDVHAFRAHIESEPIVTLSADIGPFLAEDPQMSFLSVRSQPPS